MSLHLSRGKGINCQKTLLDYSSIFQYTIISALNPPRQRPSTSKEK